MAYDLLGSAVDAEDTVQDAWLRWARRETYVGPWLPEPLLHRTGRQELGSVIG